MKAFDSALIVGRFNSFHNGHKSLVDLALTLCNRVFIFVGSSQESGTMRNPFSVETRMDCIRSVFDDKERVIIRSLPDMTHEDDINPEWGRWLIRHVKQVAHKMPEVMIYGNDEARSGWFAKEDIANVTEVIVNRHKNPISGTMMRELIHNNNVEEWMIHTPQHMHGLYSRLRDELLAATPYRFIDTERVETPQHIIESLKDLG